MTTPMIHASFRRGDTGIEIRIFAITREGNGKTRKRRQKTIATCPTLWIEGATAEHGALLFEELRKACRAFAVRLRDAPKAPPPVVYEAVTPAIEPHPLDPPPDAPVFEVRPARATPEKPARDRSEEEEIAEGLAIVQGLNR